MVGAFGLLDGYHSSAFPGDRIVERWPRVDIFWLNRIGGLVAGTTTELEWSTGGCHCHAGTGNVEVDGVPIPITWDMPMEGVDRPWWSCPQCSARCRFVYLSKQIACRRCHRLDWACRHLRRQTRGVGRVERLRRRLGDCPLQPFAPLPARVRRGRSRAYHDALVARILDEESALLGHLQTVTRDLERRIEVRKKRHQW
jgi:hypothetical protein